MAPKQPAKTVEDQDYYHGMLPREDAETLLKTPGDFLVRFTQPNLGDPPQYVISVVTGEDREEKKEGVCSYIIKHLVLDYVNKKYTFDQQLFFSDIPQLVDKYVKEQQPFTVIGKKQDYLKTGIKRPEWELQHDWVQLGDEIGSGQFGVIRKGQLVVPNTKAKQVAVKVAKTESNPEMKTKIKEMMQEARTMRHFRHPNVVALHGVAVAAEPLMIVMEFVPHGDLKKYLEKNQVSLETKMTVTLQAAKGIAYLHSKNTIHRDIAARNCLVGGDPPKTIEVKISDFGLSRPGDAYRIQHERPLPIRWLAPEVIIQQEFIQKSDVWSFAMMVIEIYSNGQEPYHGLTRDQAKEEIKKGKGPKAVKEMPEKMFTVFETKVWVPVSDRMTMQQVINELEPPPAPKKPAASPAPKNMNKSMAKSVSDVNLNKSTSTDKKQKKNKKGPVAVGPKKSDVKRNKK